MPVLCCAKHNFVILFRSARDRVESPVLERELLGMVVKLRDALKGEFARLLEFLGVRRAWEAAGFAVAWGYEDARSL